MNTAARVVVTIVELVLGAAAFLLLATFVATLIVHLIGVLS